MGGNSNAGNQRPSQPNNSGNGNVGNSNGGSNNKPSPAPTPQPKPDPTPQPTPPEENPQRIPRPGNSGMLFATVDEARAWAIAQVDDPNSQWYGSTYDMSGSTSLYQPGDPWTVDFHKEN